MKKSVADIENKLKSPDCKKNILLVTHQILQANDHARKMLKLASENLNRAVDELQNELFEQTSTEKNIFKIREVYDIIRRQFFGLKKEYERTLDKKSTFNTKLFLRNVPPKWRNANKKKMRKNFLKIASPLKPVKVFSRIVIGLPMNEIYFCKKNISSSDKKLYSNLKILVSPI